jgi:uridine kinase
MSTSTVLAGLGLTALISLYKNRAQSVELKTLEKRRLSASRRATTRKDDVVVREEDGGRPYVIGFGGPSGSGKTTFCRNICESLRTKKARVCVISCDSYYKSMPRDQDPSKYNFDEPKAVDFKLLADHLCALKRGERVQIPVYCFETHKRTSKVDDVFGEDVDVVLVEGIFALCNKDVLKELDLKVFVKEDLDVCLARRTVRDVMERGRKAEHVMSRYTTFVKPAFHLHIEPSSSHADIIIPKAGRNTCATDLLLRSILSFCGLSSSP